ncbi:hypothetical protein SO802_013942 [Lithocarpus litseifolius]|uniref:Uncharacterized protein n=1 Tax=Lithocarpus litseifolius TaxID=425828 RepID=A0AAW2DCI3_9ROSI
MDALLSKTVHFIVAVKLEYRMTHERLGEYLTIYNLCNLLSLILSTNKTVGRSESLYHTTNQNQNGAFTPEKVQVLQYLHSQSGTFPARSFSQDGFWGTAIGFQENLVLARNLVWGFKLPGGLEGNAPLLKQRKIDVSHKYGHSIENDNYLDTDFLVQLWVADRKMKNYKGKRRRKLVQHMKTNMNTEDGIWGHFFGEQDFLDKGKPVLNPPPLSQSDSAFLEPQSPDELSWV